MNNSFEIENKLIQLGIKSKYEKNRISEVEELEEILGVSFPYEYKEFLQKFGTLELNNTEIGFYQPKNIDEESITIVNFYGLNQDHFDLESVINRYTDRIPNELIPIAECPGGDQLCIGINNNSINKIYYWDHNKEKVQISMIEDMWEPVTLIYDSFFDFIMSSHELKEDEDLGDTKIENIKVSDKFLSRFKKNT